MSFEFQDLVLGCCFESEKHENRFLAHHRSKKFVVWQYDVEAVADNYKEEVTKELLETIHKYQNVNQPNIFQVLQTHIDSLTSVCSLVFEHYVCTVADAVKFGTGLSENSIGAICKSILQALRLLHNYHILHRSVRPENMFLLEDGSIKLGQKFDLMEGFGCVRRSVVNPPHYMAPEIIEGTSVTCLSDIWSLGISCLFMAEKKVPGEEIHPTRLLFLIPMRPPPKLSDKMKWSTKFDEFLGFCLQKNPKFRAEARALVNHKV